MTCAGSCCSEAGVVVLHGSAYGPGGEGTLARLVRGGRRDLEHGLERLRRAGAAGRDGRRSKRSSAGSAEDRMSLTELPVIDDPARRPSTCRRCTRPSRRPSARTSVRADRLSRALYATDASVYQIVPLDGRVPRDGGRCRGRGRACVPRFGVPITARGGGTSQAGQCDRAGRHPRLLQALRPRARDQRRRSAGPASSRGACSTT